MILEDRRDVERDIEETLGLVPEFFRRVPDYLIPTEWASFKSLELSDQTAIPNKYKELIGLAVSGATRCRYCCYFHTEAARLFGASEDEITETALIAKNTMGWSTYLNTLQFDYDQFVEEFDQVTAHVREQMAASPLPPSPRQPRADRGRSRRARARASRSRPAGTEPGGAVRSASSAIRAPATSAPSSVVVSVTDSTSRRTGSICIAGSVRARRAVAVCRPTVL